MHKHVSFCKVVNVIDGAFAVFTVYAGEGFICRRRVVRWRLSFRHAAVTDNNANNVISKKERTLVQDNNHTATPYISYKLLCRLCGNVCNVAEDFRVDLKSRIRCHRAHTAPINCVSFQKVLPFCLYRSEQLFRQ